MANDEEKVVWFTDEEGAHTGAPPEAGPAARVEVSIPRGAEPPDDLRVDGRQTSTADWWRAGYAQGKAAAEAEMASRARAAAATGEYPELPDIVRAIRERGKPFQSFQLADGEGWVGVNPLCVAFVAGPGTHGPVSGCSIELAVPYGGQETNSTACLLVVESFANVTDRLSGALKSIFGGKS